MNGFGLDPSEDALAEERAVWSESQDTRQRIRAVATGLHEPATATAVAEWANCASNTARKHLNDLVALGVVRRLEEDNGTRYVRNEAYFRWREADELASAHSIEELLDAMADLESREEVFQAQFDVPTPDAVDIPEDATHAEVENRLATLSEWATVRQALTRHRDALQLARREDERLTA